MPIRDEIRDEIYGTEPDEGESTAAEIVELTGTLDQPFAPQMWLAVVAVVEVLVAAVSWFFPRIFSRILWMFDLYSLLFAIAVAFALGAAFGLAAATLFYQWRATRNLPAAEDGIMFGFADEARH